MDAHFNPMTSSFPQWVPAGWYSLANRYLTIQYKSGSTRLQQALAFSATSQPTVFVVGVHSTGLCLLPWVSGGHSPKLGGGVDGLTASMWVFQFLRSGAAFFLLITSICSATHSFVTYSMNYMPTRMTTVMPLPPSPVVLTPPSLVNKLS